MVVDSELKPERSVSVDKEKYAVGSEKVVDAVTSISNSLRKEVGTDKVIGLDLLDQAHQFTEQEIEDRFKAVRLKVDKRLLPILCVTYVLQFLDKLSLNYASAYSLNEDLGLVGQRFSWVAAIFNFGYMFWALPSNYIIQKVPVAKFTGSMITIWAVILVAHIGCKNYGGILAVRFILGMFEAGISPSCMMICSMFYTRDDQPFRMCAFLSCNGIATMVGALLGFGLGHATESTLASWKLIFLTIGLINFVWSIIFLIFCPDSPAHAKFLTEEERSILVERVSRNNMGIKDTRFKKHQVLEAISDLGVWFNVLIGLACGVINGGVSNFSSSLLVGFGFSGINATALQLPTGAFELVVVFSAGIVTIMVKNIRCITLVLVCLPGLAGLIGIRLISLDHRWALVGCTWLQFIVGGPVILSWILLTCNVGGHTKKTVANGLWFMFYAAGNIVGANIFFTRESPKYPSAMVGLIVCYSGTIALAIAYWLLMVNRNRKRDKEQSGDAEELAHRAVIDGMKGLTDFENRGFRYAL